MPGGHGGIGGVDAHTYGLQMPKPAEVETIRKAMLTVAGQATDQADLLDLLHVLGLDVQDFIQKPQQPVRIRKHANLKWRRH